MYKLRLLKILHSKNCEVCIPSGYDDLQFLPDSLRYLHWDGYPWKSFPLGFRPEDLVELILPYSKVKKLWEGSQHLGSLKKIDISYSEHLTAFPDLSGASKLEHVYLEYCTSLQEVPSYFEHLDELKTLFLVGCSSIHKFPRVAKSIVCLALSGTSIHEVPASSIEHLCCLEILSLDFCRNVKSLPHHISKMKSLKAVTFEGTLLISKYFHDIFPWWIEKVFTLSQLSTYRHEFEGDFRFFLRPLLKLECVPKLPLVGFYRGIDMDFLLKQISAFVVPGYKFQSGFGIDFLNQV
ncbi:hypothetical protein TIFTF001_016110 [Ficus carica]|uniref:Uncharacterized protein n=1 Tax=Ficus carica TaxID=3494 RepID=A0AA88D5V0_FICCA|nr:hypothetical protein TIFTF001_016110 [Ficus carica]